MQSLAPAENKVGMFNGTVNEAIKLTSADASPISSNSELCRHILHSQTSQATLKDNAVQLAVCHFSVPGC